MYTFLKQIGPTNRILLNAIYIRISNFRYCYYTNKVIPGEVAEKNGGNYLGDAFELLSQGHNIGGIVFILGPTASAAPEKTSALAPHLFRPIEQSRLSGSYGRSRGLGPSSVKNISLSSGISRRSFWKCVCLRTQKPYIANFRWSLRNHTAHY